MMEEAPYAPVRAKSFPLQERTRWERLEEEQLCQQTRAMELFEKAHEKENIAEEKQREEAHQNLLSGLERGKELLKQLCEEAHAHEEEKKSDGEQIQVRMKPNNKLLFIRLECHHGLVRLKINKLRYQTMVGFVLIRSLQDGVCAPIF